MNITLHQLNVLKAVKHYGSITAAAHNLHMTQPAVSNIVKQLERNSHYQLTEIIGKKTFLTQAGERLVKAAEDIHTILETVTSDLHFLEGEISGALSVAIVSTAKYFVPKLLGEFHKKYSLVKIKLTVCNRQQAVDILKNNVCDFLVMSQLPNNIAINKQLFYHDKLVVVSSPDMPTNQCHYQLKDLDDSNWVIRESGSGTRIVMQTLFKKNKMNPNITMEVGNNESIKQIIMANLGISIVSKQSIELELQHQLIKILPVVNFPLPHPWYLVTNKGKQLSTVTRAFFDFVKQYQHQPDGLNHHSQIHDV